MARYLAHAVIHDGQVFRHSIVSIDNGILTIRKFEREEHSTIFVPGIIIVAAEEKITRSGRRQLSALFRKEQLIESGIKKVMRYLLQHDIFARDKSDTPILLPIEH